MKQRSYLLLHTHGDPVVYNVCIVGLSIGHFHFPNFGEEALIKKIASHDNKCLTESHPFVIAQSLSSTVSDSGRGDTQHTLHTENKSFRFYNNACRSSVRKSAASRHSAKGSHKAAMCSRPHDVATVSMGVSGLKEYLLYGLSKFCWILTKLCESSGRKTAGFDPIGGRAWRNDSYSANPYPTSHSRYQGQMISTHSVDCVVFVSCSCGVASLSTESLASSWCSCLFFDLQIHCMGRSKLHPVVQALGLSNYTSVFWMLYKFGQTSFSARTEEVKSVRVCAAERSSRQTSNAVEHDC